MKGWLRTTLNSLPGYPATGLIVLLTLIALCPQADAPALDRAAIYKKYLAQLPAAVGEFSALKPDLADEIGRSYATMREVCPSMRDIDISSPWNLANWLDHNVSEAEWKTAPYNFRKAAYRAVSVQANTKVKTEVLAELQYTIVHHPAYLMWVDDGKERFYHALKKDVFLNHEKADWKNVIKDEARLKAYLAAVTALSIHSYLPGIKTEMPEIIINTDNAWWLGMHQWQNNDILFNFNKDDGLKTAEMTDRIAAHESFHAVQTIIKNWYLDPSIKQSVFMADAGEKYFYSSSAKLAYTQGSDEQDAYRNTFNERMAYYVMSAAGPTLYLQTRSPEWIKAHPLTDNEFDHPDRGTLPKACFE